MYMYTYIYIYDFPCGSVIKNQPANAEDLGSIPGLGRSPGEGNGNPISVLFSDSFPIYHYRVLSRVPCAIQSVVTDYLFY